MTISWGNNGDGISWDIYNGIYNKQYMIYVGLSDKWSQYKSQSKKHKQISDFDDDSPADTQWDNIRQTYVSQTAHNGFFRD